MQVSRGVNIPIPTRYTYYNVISAKMVVELQAN